MDASLEDAPFVAEPASDTDSDEELEFCGPQSAGIETGEKPLPGLWDLESFSRALVCSYQGEHPKAECAYGRCASCGIKSLNWSLKEKSDMTAEVRYKIFRKRFDENARKKDGSRGKTVLEYAQVVTTLAEVIRDTQAWLKGFIPHQLEASWQGGCWSSRKATLQHDPMDKTLLLSIDFSMNLDIKYSKEVQSLFFSNPQCSLFVVCAYVHLQPGTFINQAHMFWSDCKKHDAAYATAGLRRVIDYYRSLNWQGTSIEIWSDGASAHFKSRQACWFLSDTVADQCVDIDRHYFATSHGKGAHDSAGGWAKRGVGMEMVKPKGKFLRDARGIVRFASKEPCMQGKRIALHVVDKEGYVNKLFYYKHWHLKESNLEDLRVTCPSNLRPVKGIQSMHFIAFRKDDPKGVLHARRLSCHCGSCDERQYSMCWKPTYTGGELQKHDIQPGMATFKQKRKALSTTLPPSLPLSNVMYRDVVALAPKCMLGSCSTTHQSSQGFMLLMVERPPYKSLWTVYRIGGHKSEGLHDTVVAKTGQLVMSGYVMQQDTDAKVGTAMVVYKVPPSSRRQFVDPTCILHAGVPCNEESRMTRKSNMREYHISKALLDQIAKMASKADKGKRPMAIPPDKSATKQAGQHRVRYKAK